MQLARRCRCRVRMLRVPVSRPATPSSNSWRSMKRTVRMMKTTSPMASRLCSMRTNSTILTLTRSLEKTLRLSSWKRMPKHLTCPLLHRQNEPTFKFTSETNSRRITVLTSLLHSLKHRTWYGLSAFADTCTVVRLYFATWLFSTLIRHQRVARPGTWTGNTNGRTIGAMRSAARSVLSVPHWPSSCKTKERNPTCLTSWTLQDIHASRMRLQRLLGLVMEQWSLSIASKGWPSMSRG